MFIRPSRLLAITLVLFQIHPLYGATKATLAVPPLEGAKDDRARNAIVEALRKTGRVVVVEPKAVDQYIESRTEQPGADAGTDVASEKLSKGQNAYRKLNIDKARSLLREAKAEFRRHLSADGASEGLRAAQFHLSMVYLASGDHARAKAEIREVVLLDPEREKRKLSKKLYPPDVRNLYETIRNEIAEKDHGTLHIRSRPAGAMVYLDGKALGPTPTQARKVPVGEHFIRISAEGVEPFFGPKFVVKGDNRIDEHLKSALTIDPSVHFTAVKKTSEIDHRRAAFLDEMGLALGADVFVFLNADQGAVSGQLYDQRSQEISPIEKASDPEALAKKLVRHLDEDGYVAPLGEKDTPDPAQAKTSEQNISKTPPPSTTLKDQIRKPQKSSTPLSEYRPWYKNYWLWIGVGAALLAGGGAVLLFTDVAKKDATSSTLILEIPGS